MRMRLTSLFALLAFFCYGQVAPNFVITDVTGTSQNLYVDYLNAGKVVVLKIFFVNCPPCNSAAPIFQQKYVNWGSGTQDVQFIELSNKVTDNNNLVQGYKDQHGITFPIAGAQGGSVEAQQLYTNGTFGPFYGTPTYIVISPDKEVNYNVSLSGLDAAIEAARDVTFTPGTPIQLLTTENQMIPSGIDVFMKPANASAPVVNLTEVTGGTLDFVYPSANVPAMTDPVIYIESYAPALTSKVRASDLVAIRKHILGLELFTDERKLIASDVNNDDRIRATDLVEIRKVILGLSTDFPAGVPSYKLYPEQMILDVSGPTAVNVYLDIIKMGNVVD